LIDVIDPVDDYGFDLQKLKDTSRIKKCIKLLLLFGFCCALASLFNILFHEINSAPKEIVVVKSNVQSIKRLPNDADNAKNDQYVTDTTVHNLVSDSDNVRPKIHRTEQSVAIDMNTDTDNSVFLEQKIGELSEATDKNHSDIGDDVLDDMRVAESRQIVQKDIDKSNNIASYGIKVQIFVAKSKNAVDDYWNDVAHKYPQLFLGKNHYLERLKIKDNNFIYRLQIGDFEDVNEANRFCETYIRLTSKTNLDCVVI